MCEKKEEVILKAPAKVNLFLQIKTVQDGYHLLDMLNFPLDLKDILHVSQIDEKKDQILFSEHEIPEQNTISKTLEILRTKGLQNHYQIIVEKQIPSQAGLAGGSADAAVLLNYLNEAEHLHLSKAELVEIALEIGADVPYCLNPSPARIQGKGEIRKAELKPGKIKALLIHPGFGISTPRAFALYDRLSKEKSSKELISQEKRLALAIKAWNGQDYPCFFSLIENDLEPVAFALEPQLFEIKASLQARAHQLDPDSAVIMSGSGSTLLVLAKEKALETLYEDLKEDYPVVRKVVIG